MNSAKTKTMWGTVGFTRCKLSLLVMCLVLNNFINFVRMKKHEILVMKPFAAALLIVSLAFVSCKKEQKATVIIAKKPARTERKAIQRVGDCHDSRRVEWGGSTYAVAVERTADTSLPLVADEGGNRYYDNAITLTIEREDGTTFFRRRFTKSDFAGSIAADDSHGALLGIVFDYADDTTLYFAASVGSPDKLSDEYVPLVLAISRNGDITIKKDTHLDTASNDGSDEGV